MDLESAIQEEIPDPGCASKSDFSLMPTEFPDDETIDELLRLAGVSTERSAARRWLESALAAARGTPERGWSRNHLRQSTTPHSTRLSEPVTG